MRHSRIETRSRHSLSFLLTRRRTRWLLTGIVAITALAWTISTVNEAERATTAWGERRTVAIALVDLEPGHVITADDISFSSRPRAMIPEGVADAPLGRIVTRRTIRDEVLLDARLSGGATTGPTAFLDERTIAFSIPRDTTTPSVQVGDRVTLFAPSDVVATGSRAVGPAIRITNASVVVLVDDDSVMVGVDLTDAPIVARSLLSGAVLLGLTE